MLQFDRDANLLNIADTANLLGSLYNDAGQPYTADDLVSVSFVVQRPDGERIEDIQGTIEDDGTGTGKYADTDLTGQYIVMASFTLANGDTKSVRSDFEVVDPFVEEEPTELETLAIHVWQRFEDMFDVEDEGPWLRDQTLNYFNRRKMPQFVDEALFRVNQGNPPTTLAIGYFFNAGEPTADLPLLVQGTYLAVVRHLIRSYVEQPQPMGAQVVYQDRRDYLTRWKLVYDYEEALWVGWVALFKRQFLGLGHAKVLIDTKAGRLTAAPLRTRFVGRGWY